MTAGGNSLSHPEGGALEMEIIQSLHNPKVQLWRSLKDARGRKEHRLFLVEGTRFVQEALQSSFPIQAILLREDYEPKPALVSRAPVFHLADHVFQAVCDTKTPQGIAAILSPQTLPVRGNAVLALDGIQDPGNLGTMIRTADAAGFTGVLISPECCDLFSPKALRATMGSLFHIGITISDDFLTLLNQYKQNGFSLLSSQLDGTPFFERSQIRPSFILIVGNEGNGVSEAVRKIATHHLCLPMQGAAESLNAAVAAGIMMYDLMRFSSAQ